MKKPLSEEETYTLNIVSHSSTQTQRLGMRLGTLLQGGELILLDGRLGMGKTTFTQGLAQGLGIGEVINSPTFTLLKEYAGQPRQPLFDEQEQANPPTGTVAMSIGPALYHFDLYRLDDPEEIIDLGFEDYFYGSGVSVVEWAEKADDFWPPERLRVQMKMLSETKRGLLFLATGTRYCELLKHFQKNAYAITGS